MWMLMDSFEENYSGGGGAVHRGGGGGERIIELLLLPNLTDSIRLCSGDEFARKLLLLGVFQSPEVDNP
jgi:hypothetical protein